MPVASFVMATHCRPKLLGAAIAALLDQRDVPAGWSTEIVVCHYERDHAARELLATLPVVAFASHDPTGGGKRSAAFRRSHGELVMAVDDDDLQSPWRARAAITAYQAGAFVSESKEWRYLELATGRVCRWEGRADPLRARIGVRVGTARNYRCEVLVRVGAWGQSRQLMEKTLQWKLDQHYKAPVVDLVELEPAIAAHTIAVQHGHNIWADRPFPRAGETVRRGDFYLRGEGQADAITDFPPAALLHLRKAFGGVLPWWRG